MPSKHFDVFLCHNSRDKKVVSHIGRRLSEHKVCPWLDQWNLVPGDPWQTAIETALNKCSACAIFLGPFIGPWQHEEMRAAIDRRVSGDTAFRVMPVLLPGTSVPNARSLPAFLRANEWVEFSGLDDETALHRLICGVRGTEPGDVVFRIPPQMEGRVAFEIALDGTFTASNKKRVLKAVQGLQDLLDDQTLRVKRIRSGSIVVELDGARSGYEWLQDLSIASVRQITPNARANSQKATKRGSGRNSRSGRIDTFDTLVDHLLDGGIFLQQAIEIVENSMIKGALYRSAGNQGQASKLLGIHRNTLQRKIVAYEIGRERSRRKPLARSPSARSRGSKLA